MSVVIVITSGCDHDHERGRVSTPYGLQIVEDCISYPVIKDRVFCDLPRGTLDALDSIALSFTYPRGAILFLEGHKPKGVHILCQGRVKLYGTSSTGKSVIFRIAEAGELIGLPSTLSGNEHEVTAEVLEPVQTNFVRRHEFLEYLSEHHDAAMRVAVMLSRIYYSTCQEVRYLGLSTTPAEKMARFLLDLKPRGNLENDPKVILNLTHDEVARMIGTSRETVSRVLASFKRNHLIEMRGRTVWLSNREALRELARIV